MADAVTRNGSKKRLYHEDGLLWYVQPETLRRQCLIDRNASQRWPCFSFLERNQLSTCFTTLGKGHLSSGMGTRAVDAEETHTRPYALQASQRLKSKLNRDRIESLYRQLQSTSLRNDPKLVRLGVQLQMWTVH